MRKAAGSGVGREGSGGVRKGDIINLLCLVE